MSTLVNVRQTVSIQNLQFEPLLALFTIYVWCAACLTYTRANFAVYGANIKTQQKRQSIHKQHSLQIITVSKGKFCNVLVVFKLKLLFLICKLCIKLLILLKLYLMDVVFAAVWISIFPIMCVLNSISTKPRRISDNFFFMKTTTFLSPPFRYYLFNLICVCATGCYCCSILI